jgi:hypothetical protein
MAILRRVSESGSGEQQQEPAQRRRDKRFHARTSSMAETEYAAALNETSHANSRKAHCLLIEDRSFPERV